MPAAKKVRPDAFDYDVNLGNTRYKRFNEHTTVPSFLFHNAVTGGYAARPNHIVRGSVTGVKQQDWKKRILSGQSASSPYAADKAFVLDARPWAFQHNAYHLNGANQEDGRFKVESFGYGHNLANYGDTLALQMPHVTGASTQVDNEAISRLHSKIRENSTAINGSTFLGELRETIGMLRSPFRSAREHTVKYMKALNIRRQQVIRSVPRRQGELDRKLSIRRAQALKDGMSDAWLELQFGLKPLISDTKDIIEGLGRMIGEHDPVDRIVARKNVATQSAIVENSRTNPWLCINVDLNKIRVTQTGVQYIAIYRRKYDGSVGLIGRAQETFGLDTFENFVPTLWELTPWSFLFDYFVNIGSIIEASTTSTAGLVTCVKTVRQRTIMHVIENVSSYSEPNTGSGNVWITGYLGGTLWSVRSFLRATVTRTPMDTLPIPSLSFTAPGFESTKWVNMAALLASGHRLSQPSGLLAKGSFSHNLTFF